MAGTSAGAKKGWLVRKGGHIVGVRAGAPKRAWRLAMRLESKVDPELRAARTTRVKAKLAARAQRKAANYAAWVRTMQDDLPPPIKFSNQPWAGGGRSMKGALGFGRRR